MEVIHDWPDDESVAILRAVRAAAKPGATLLVIEDVLFDDRLDRRALTLDVIMLTVTGGRERTPEQLAELFRAAGFRLSAVVPTRGPLHLVEGTAV
jgi:hypothetical protein